MKGFVASFGQQVEICKHITEGQDLTAFENTCDAIDIDYLIAGRHEGTYTAIQADNLFDYGEQIAASLTASLGPEEFLY